MWRAQLKHLSKILFWELTKLCYQFLAFPPLWAFLPNLSFLPNLLRFSGGNKFSSPPCCRRWPSTETRSWTQHLGRSSGSWEKMRKSFADASSQLYIRGSWICQDYLFRSASRSLAWEQSDVGMQGLFSQGQQKPRLFLLHTWLRGCCMHPFLFVH